MKHPSNKLTVIIRDDGPLIHANASPSYRSVHIQLTDAQVQQLTLKSVAGAGEHEVFEAIDRCFIEPGTQDGKHSIPKTTAPVESEHREFIKDWTEAYKAKWQVDYAFQAGRDGIAVKKLLQLRPRKDLIAIAQTAWNGTTFECKRAQTIHGFLHSFNEINLQVKNGTTDNGTRGSVNQSNPRNYGVHTGGADYGKAVPRLQRDIEAKRRMAEQVASNGNHPPTSESRAVTTS